MDNNDENNQELNNEIVDTNADETVINEELDEIKFQKLNDEAMRANEKLLSLEDIIAGPEHQLTIIYGDDSILHISKVGDIMNDMRPITTDKKVLSPSNIVIPQTNKQLKEITNDPNGFVPVDVYSGIIIPTTPNTEDNTNVIQSQPTTDQLDNNNPEDNGNMNESNENTEEGK